MRCTPNPYRHEPGDVVLVVEDEAAVRLFCCTVLRRFGYHVLEAAGPGRSARHAADRRPVGLVLTDITMPGMNGKEMVKRIDREQQPDLRVLYMSGYTREPRSWPELHREALYVCGFAEARARSRSERPA